MASVHAAVTAAPGGRPLPLGDRFRRGATTTPGRMRLLSLAVVVTMIVAGAVGIGAVTHRLGGVHTVGTESEPLMVDAQAIDTLLSQADAAAANAFLGGGIEPAAQRNLYSESLRSATQTLADAAGRSGNSAAARVPLRTLSEQIPVYAGLVETARANNRQLFPVGAGYLRQASRLMASTILPAAQQLYAVDAARFTSGDHRARSAADAAAPGLMVIALLVILIGVQIWLRRRTNRLFNLPMVFATVIAAGMMLFALSSLRAEASEVTKARTKGFASVNSLAQSRIAAFKAKGDESFTLIGRGNGGVFDNDFNAQMAKVAPLLDQASAQSVSASEQATVRDAASALQAYLAVHKKIRGLDDGGQFVDAVNLAVDTSGAPTSANGTFAVLDQRLTKALTASQVEFGTRTRAADHRLAGLRQLLLLALFVAGLLALAGMQQRINEYR